MALILRIILGLGLAIFGLSGFRVADAFRSKRLALKTSVADTRVDDAFYRWSSAAATWSAFAFIVSGVAVGIPSPSLLATAFALLAIGAQRFGHGYELCAGIRRELKFEGYQDRAQSDEWMAGSAKMAAVAVIVIGISATAWLAITVQHL